MTRPIDLVLSRAEGHGLRSSGRDRWRMVGACHGGSNPSAVSIGVGNTDSVLLKCWHGCSVEEVAHALGLAVLVEAHNGAEVLRRVDRLDERRPT